MLLDRVNFLVFYKEGSIASVRQGGHHSIVGRLVLIADDHELIRDLLSSILVTHGFDVCHASDGAQAVQIARQKSPDLVVLDLAMPVMNGLEAARILKAKMPQVPLVMFTNTIGPSVEHQAQSAGIIALFSKSDSPTLLVDAVNALLS
jgi:CheY-like chemotaxis protein